MKLRPAFLLVMGASAANAGTLNRVRHPARGERLSLPAGADEAIGRELAPKKDKKKGKKGDDGFPNFQAEGCKKKNKKNKDNDPPRGVMYLDPEVDPICGATFTVATDPTSSIPITTYKVIGDINELDCSGGNGPTIIGVTFDCNDLTIQGDGSRDNPTTGISFVGESTVQYCNVDGFEYNYDLSEENGGRNFRKVLADSTSLNAGEAGIFTGSVGGDKGYATTGPIEIINYRSVNDDDGIYGVIEGPMTVTNPDMFCESPGDSWAIEVERTSLGDLTVMGGMFENCYYGISSSTIGAVYISNVMVQDTGDDGIEIRGSGIEGPPCVTIEDSRIVNSGGTGIKVQDVIQVIVDRTFVANSKRAAGLQFRQSESVTIKDSYALYNKRKGISIDARVVNIEGSYIGDSYSEGYSTGDGIYLEAPPSRLPARARITCSVIEGSEGSGIFVEMGGATIDLVHSSLFNNEVANLATSANIDIPIISVVGSRLCNDGSPDILDLTSPEDTLLSGIDLSTATCDSVQNGQGDTLGSCAVSCSDVDLECDLGIAVAPCRKNPYDVLALADGYELPDEEE